MRLAVYANCAPMRRFAARILRFALLCVVSGAWLSTADTAVAAPPRVVASRLRVELQRVINRPPGSDLNNPTIGLAFAPSDTSRIFLVEKGGSSARIRAFDNGIYSTVLDLTSEVKYNNENGLLGMAFHPGFADPLSPGYRKLYTYHSVPTDANAVVDFPTSLEADHQNLVTEWQISANNPNQVDLSTRREIFREAHPQFEHNGGTITFGPDGYLYGAIGAPGNTLNQRASQNTSNLLGKVFRIDPLDPSLTPASANPISANGKYRVPADNPFVNVPQALDEIFALGFRNPYRFSVDPVSGLAFIGDVGQGVVEEVDVIAPGGNFGWPYREGTQEAPFGIPVPNPAPTLIDPIAAYPHTDGRAIVGGYVYRGSIPTLQGKYIFGDFSNNFFSGLGKLFVADPFDAAGNLQDPANVHVRELYEAPATCSESPFANPNCTFDSVLFSFAVDSDGELYALGWRANRAVVYKFTDAYTLPEGDYNEDGTVDARDYTIWRDTLGQTVALGSKADGDGSGTIDAGDYAVWKAHFGESVAIGSGGGSAAQSAVPEPGCSILAIAGLSAAVWTRRLRRA